MRITFSKHAVDRYKERMTCIDGTAVENWCQNVERLAREIERTGSWYYYPKTDFYFCVVRNLKVYVGFFSKGKLTIVTAYAYTKKMRSTLNKCEHVPRDEIEQLA